MEDTRNISQAVLLVILQKAEGISEWTEKILNPVVEKGENG